MTCTTCALPVHANSRGHSECHVCRRNRTYRERVRDGRQPFSQWMTGRIVGQAMAKFYVRTRSDIQHEQGVMA